MELVGVEVDKGRELLGVELAGNTCELLGVAGKAEVPGVSFVESMGDPCRELISELHFSGLIGFQRPLHLQIPSEARNINTWLFRGIHAVRARLFRT